MNAALASSVDALGTRAANVAMKAAADRLIELNAHKGVDYEVLCRVIRSNLYAVLDAALAEAQAAIEVGMVKVAEATFLASMRLAGVVAANEYLAGKAVA
jgi:hypothetical protein